MKKHINILTYRINGEVVVKAAPSAAQLEADFKSIMHLTDYHLFTKEVL